MIVKTDHQAIIHHYRDEAGAITTRIIRDGTVTLDPPRIVLANVFADIPC